MLYYARRLLLAATATVAVIPATANASVHSIQQRYTDVRVAVIHKFGVQTAGRNIRRYGLNTPQGPRKASTQDYEDSIAAYMRWLHPAVISAVTTTSTVVSSSASVSYTPTAVSSSLESCILAREGAGPTTVNSSGHMGIGQWDQATWEAQGGTQYASSPTGASYSQQKAVLEHALATGHADAWRPYDGC